MTHVTHVTYATHPYYIEEHLLHVSRFRFDVSGSQDTLYIRISWLCVLELGDFDAPWLGRVFVELWQYALRPEWNQYEPRVCSLISFKMCRTDLYTPKGAAVKYSDMNRVANSTSWNPLLWPRWMKATVTNTIAVGNRVWLRQNVVTCSFLPFCYGIFCWSTRCSCFIPTRWFDKVWSPYRPSRLKMVGDSEPLQ
jgi:hypothetical protein